MNITAIVSFHITGLAASDMSRIIGSLAPATTAPCPVAHETPAPAGVRQSPKLTVQKPSADSAGELMLTAKEFAQVIGVTLGALRARLQRGSVPAPIKLTDGRLNWRATDVDSWLANQERAAK